MLHTIESHGIEFLIGYFVFSSIVSTMPPLPETASYWAKWAFGLLHALASDWKQVLAMAKVPLPDPEPNSTVTKTVVNQTTIEKKVD